MNLLRPALLVLASLVPPAACAPSSDEGPPPSTPDVATLCKIVFGSSHVSDALALLGPPETNETFANGSGFLAYQFQTSPQVVVLELDFDSTELLTDAITINLARPACWPSPSDAGGPTDGGFSLDADSTSPSDAASPDAPCSDGDR